MNKKKEKKKKENKKKENKKRKERKKEFNIFSVRTVSESRFGNEYELSAN